MNLKKYISVIIIILTLIGIAGQQQVDVHNQEIVFKFNTSENQTVDAKAAVTVIKTELKNLGVTNFKVVDNENGKLKITYFSDTEVSEVKRILIKNVRSALDQSDDEEAPFHFPEENSKIAYNLDVKEIKKSNSQDSGLNGVAVLELKLKTDRFSKPTTVFSYSDTSEKIECVAVHLDVRQQFTIVFAIQNTLQKIPEVRAGPCC